MVKTQRMVVRDLFLNQPFLANPTKWPGFCLSSQGSTPGALLRDEEGPLTGFRPGREKRLHSSKLSPSYFHQGKERAQLSPDSTFVPSSPKKQFLNK